MMACLKSPSLLLRKNHSDSFILFPATDDRPWDNADIFEAMSSFASVERAAP